MELSETNLYSNGRVIVFPYGTKKLIREKLVIKPGPNDKYHTVRAGDELDFIAWFRYRNDMPDASKLWWVIADANNIMNPLDISEYIGKDLLVPDINRVLLLIE